jgi:hypothetical protein
MSTDKELLELAAKAYGLKGRYFDYEDKYGPIFGIEPIGDSFKKFGITKSYWNPLIDDGAALRLMVKLEIDILFYRKHVDACDNTKTQNVAREDFNSDKNASVRLAIVRAAAEIGRAMP